MKDEITYGETVRDLALGFLEDDPLWRGLEPAERLQHVHELASRIQHAIDLYFPLE